MLARLRGIVAEVVGSSAIEDDEPLMAAGLDSLAVVELRGRVESAFGVALRATAALDYPTLKVSTGPVQTTSASLARPELWCAARRLCDVGLPATDAVDLPTLKKCASNPQYTTVYCESESWNVVNSRNVHAKNARAYTRAAL